MGDFSTDTPGHFSKRLIAGHLHDDMISGAKGHIHEIEDRFLCPGMHKHVIGGDIFVQCSNCLAESGIA